MASPAELLVGRVAVARDVITLTQFEAALHAQEQCDPAPPLPVLLVEQGAVSWTRLDEFFTAALPTFSQLGASSRAQIQTWRIAGRAVQRGFAAPEQVGRALREQAARLETQDADASILSILREQRALDAWQGQELSAIGDIPEPPRLDGSAQSGTLATPIFVSAVQRRPPVSPPRSEPAPAVFEPPPPPPLPRAFGVYILEEELGRGGMGVVYKAHHPGLQRYYAVKVLIAGEFASAEDVARLRREAQSAASLQHPGIVRVHDVGEEQGQVYLAMEYVDGRPLDLMLGTSHGESTPTIASDAPLGKPITDVVSANTPERGLPPASAAKLTLEIAEAIQAAHDAGIIHRDLKPGNVLVDEAGHARVMDFGLAKQIRTEQSVLTRSGMIMGTPAYMSPEQARGHADQVDAQSDVYQIGAILYELLTGRQPYDGDTAYDILRLVTQQPPRPVRHWNPLLPRDLETVVLKAMARDKRDRYLDARSLAEDLGRFLKGEPVRARRDPVWKVAVRWSARRRAVVGLGAIVAVALLVTGIATWRARALENQILDGLRAIARTNLDGALAVRRAGGKLRDAEQGFLEPLQAAVRDAETRAPGLAEPQYHLGRLFRALLRFDEALAAQDRALALDADYAPALYERAILHTLSYGRRIDELRERWVRDEGRRLAAGGFLEKAGLGGAALPERPADDLLVGKDAEAGRLRRFVRADLTRLDRHGAGGPVSAGMLSCAHALLQAYDGADDERATARKMLASVVQSEPTLEEAVEGLAHLMSVDGDPLGAVEVYARGLERDRGYVPFHLGRGQILFEFGAYLANHGQDPESVNRDGIADFTAAVDLEPDNPQGWRGRGLLWMNEALRRNSAGEDPFGEFTRALADFDTAVKLAPADAQLRIGRADVRSRWASALLRRGQDPEPHYVAALADLDRALELDAQAAMAWMWRGDIRSRWGSYLQTVGKDPEPLFSAAIADFARALAIDPAFPYTFINRGLAWLGLAAYRERTGREGEEQYAASVADLGKSIETFPSITEAWGHRAEAEGDWALARENHGKDPLPLYRDAQRDFDHALEMDPKSWQTLEARGDNHFNRGLYEKHRGGDPDPFWEHAVADYTHAIAENPSAAAPYARRALLRVAWADHRKQNLESARTLFEQAGGDLHHALELNPSSAELWMRKGMFEANWGLFLQREKEDPDAHLAFALQALGRAIELNPGLAEPWMHRGRTHAMQGVFRREKGEDAAEDLRLALADFTAAIERNKMLAEAYVQRGLLQHMLEHWREARDDLVEAARLNPPDAEGNAPALKDATEKAEILDKEESWEKLSDQARELMQKGDYPAARSRYEEGLRLFGEVFAWLAQESREKLEHDSRERLAEAHYNLACVLSLASAGKDGPHAAAHAIAADAATRLLDGAVAQLREAIRLGFAEREQFDQDADLAPLRAGERWKEILDALKSGGK